jgi:hypothetical protein
MIDIKRETATKPQKGTKSIGARVTEVRYAQVLQFANDAGMNISDWLNMIIDRHEIYDKIKPILITAVELKLRNTKVDTNHLTSSNELQKWLAFLKKN